MVSSLASHYAVAKGGRFERRLIRIIRRPRDPSVRGGVVLPLVFLAIGAYCIAFPEAILDDPVYAKLRKRSFGAACGLLFVAAAIGFHAHDWWGRKGFARVSHVGRLIGGIMGIGSFIYIFKCIIDKHGWPW